MRRALLIWGALFVCFLIPIALAANSPYLAWRQPIYIVSGFAGILAFCLIVLQPILALDLLPGLSRRTSRRIHVWVGASLLGFVLLHIAGLWITSPPDVVDALLFRSATPFSAWGVIATLLLLFAALIAVLRRRLNWRIWRIAHAGLTALVIIGTVVHAVLIEGTMEPISKLALCSIALGLVVRLSFAIRENVLRNNERN